MRYLIPVFTLMLAACGGGESNNSAEALPQSDCASANESQTHSNSTSKEDRDRAAELSARAAGLITERDNTAALDLAMEAVSLDPDRPEYRAQLAYIYENLGRFEEAYVSYLEAESLFEGTERGRARRGAARAASSFAEKMRSQNDLDTALKFAEKAVELDPIVPGHHLEVGHVHMQREEYGKAIDAYDAALGVAVGQEEVDVLHWKAQAQFGAAEYRNAIETFTKLIDLSAEGYEAYGMRGYCYTQVNEKDKAIRDFTQAVQRTTDKDKRAEYEEVLSQLNQLGDQE